MQLLDMGENFQLHCVAMYYTLVQQKLVTRWHRALQTDGNTL